MFTMKCLCSVFCVWAFVCPCVCVCLLCHLVTCSWHMHQNYGFASCLIHWLICIETNDVIISCKTLLLLNMCISVQPATRLSLTER